VFEKENQGDFKNKGRII
jgi:hypothetical protein